MNIGLFGSILTNPILGTIGIHMTIQCLQMLSNTTQEIYGLITTLQITTYHVNIGSLLMELDLASEILFLESLLKEIDIENNHTQTLAISLKLLNDCLNDIHSLLHDVNKRIEYNNKIWQITNIMNIREYKFDDISGKLNCLAINLEKRKRNLMYTIQIKDKLILAPNIQINVCDKEEDLVSIDKVSIRIQSGGNKSLVSVPTVPTEEPNHCDG